MKKIKQMNSIRSAVFILAIATVFLSEFLVKDAQAAANSTLYFNPASYSATVDQDFTLDAMINPGTNQVTGVSLAVSFNPDKFRLDSISTAGSPFSVTLPGSSTNNNTGAATIDVAVPPGSPTVPVTATAKVATFSFHSLTATSASPIAFASSSYAVAIGEAQDVLTARNSSQVTATSGVAYSNSDFANLAADWMETLPASPADVNSDGVVNSRDLGIMMSNWQ